ncbi:MAG: hypothetical protein ACLTCK_11680 [Oscillospiraceae bacterium]
MLGSKKKEEVLPVNEALLNVITPMGLEIKRNSLVIGENLGKVYGAVRYPQKVDMGWLSKITNIPSTIVSVGIPPLIWCAHFRLSKSIVQQRGAADSVKDPLTRQRVEKAAEDGEISCSGSTGGSNSRHDVADRDAGGRMKPFTKSAAVWRAPSIQKCSAHLANSKRKGSRYFQSS